MNQNCYLYLKERLLSIAINFFFNPRHFKVHLVKNFNFYLFYLFSNLHLLNHIYKSNSLTKKKFLNLYYLIFLYLNFFLYLHVNFISLINFLNFLIINKCLIYLLLRFLIKLIQFI